jgi:hypothetical protein
LAGRLSLGKRDINRPLSQGKKPDASQIDEHKLVRDVPFYGTTAIAGGQLLSSNIAGVPEGKEIDEQAHLSGR